MKNTPSKGYVALHLNQEDRARRVRRIIQEELTDLQRDAILAYYFERKTLEQIGKERGVNKSTIWRTLRRGENKLRKFLKY